MNNETEDCTETESVQPERTPAYEAVLEWVESKENFTEEQLGMLDVYVSMLNELFSQVQERPRLREPTERPDIDEEILVDQQGGYHQLPVDIGISVKAILSRAVGYKSYYSQPGLFMRMVEFGCTLEEGLELEKRYKADQSSKDIMLDLLGRCLLGVTYDVPQEYYPLELISMRHKFPAEYMEIVNRVLCLQRLSEPEPTDS